MSDRLVALIDMDCFYCQVETRINPLLKGKPMAVVQYNQWKGGGIIAVNYEARDKGVTRHMRGDEAKKHCPEIQLVSVPAVRGKADLTKYRDAGREVIKVICEFSECVQRASVDEAYIDLTEAVEKRLASSAKVTPVQLENTFIVGYSPADGNDGELQREGVETWLREVYDGELSEPGLHRLATAAALVEQMRAAVYDQTGFRCSAGVSHNKILAKLVCGMHKPNRQTVLPMAGVEQLYRSLPVKKVRNLGGKLGDDVVETLNITYMSELANFSEKQLQAKYDEKTGSWLYNIARGIDLDPVTPRLISKSIGCCKKFPGKTALSTKTNVTHWLSELAAEVAERLDEDIHMNKRKAQLLTIHFSQELGGKDVSMSRSVALPGYEAEKIASCSYNVLAKNSSVPQNDDVWYPPLKYLGLSAGKFMDYSGNTSNSIDKFFKAMVSSSSAKTDAKDAPSEMKSKFYDNDEDQLENSTTKEKTNTCGKCVSENINQSEEQENKPTSATINILNENEKDLNSINTKGQCSFFEKYFMSKNQPDKIIRSGFSKQNLKESIGEETNKSQFPNIEHPTNNERQSRIEGEENVISSVKENEHAPERSNDGDDAWISPSELFPDLENIDDSLVNILPSPLQRKISELRNLKSAGECSSRDKVYINCNSRVSTDSDRAPITVKTVADIHRSSSCASVSRATASSSSKIALECPINKEESESLEAEGLFDETSIDVFALESNHESEEVPMEVCDVCSYCQKSIPVLELQEHLDHHMALELQKEWNKQLQPSAVVVSKPKDSCKAVAAVVSVKKKRGRPSKKDVVQVPPKKSRTLMSFFSRS